jgi:hypothetical protein
MKRVGDIREKRAERFWEERMKGKAARELASDRATLENELHLIQAPDSLRAGAVAEQEADAQVLEEAEVEAMEEETLVAAPKAKKSAVKAKTPKLKVAASERRMRG